MGYMILLEASLSFLGLGIPPQIPAWGSMVAAGRDYLLVAPWVSTMPGIAILILVLSINVFGEGLRDILDPRLKID
jgi:peptide/nickel transport system permease protein